MFLSGLPKDMLKFVWFRYVVCLVVTRHFNSNKTNYIIHICPHINVVSNCELKSAKHNNFCLFFCLLKQNTKQEKETKFNIDTTGVCSIV